MSLQVLALLTSVLVAAFLFVLLRTRRMKEKYAAMWLVLAVAVCVIGVFPPVVVGLAEMLGFETASNLLFAAALAILFLVSIHLSVELSTIEEETRTLTEEVAMLRLDLEQLEKVVDSNAEPTPPDTHTEERPWTAPPDLQSPEPTSQISTPR